MADSKRISAGHFGEEYISIGLALGLSALGAFFFYRMPGFQPESHVWYFGLAWLVLAYLACQLVVLLSTAIDSHSIGFIDSMVSLFPAILGAIIGVNFIQGMIKLSTFQENALLLMIGTSVLESLITLWVRFTVNRRSIGLNTDN